MLMAAKAIGRELSDNDIETMFQEYLRDYDEFERRLKLH